MSGGVRGRDLLDELIKDAGPKAVEAAYRTRMAAEAKTLSSAA
ncbi:hypothetical protein ACMA5I_06675 [Paracoccaceae bacterium GXU_MW_L88]